MSVKPHIENAPGLTWRLYKGVWCARWQARTGLVRLGFRPKSIGFGQVGWPIHEQIAADIAAECRVRQAESLAFSKANGPGRYKQPARAYEWLIAHKGHDGDECLIWPFGKHNRYGYGLLRADGRTCQAHRLMCEWTHGPAPEGKPYAAHECGNGHLGCVNPRHIQWKSPSENVLDKHKHGTMRGNTHGARTLLSAATIADIQSRRLSQWGFAELYGISHGAVKYWQAKAPRKAA